MFWMLNKEVIQRLYGGIGKNYVKVSVAGGFEDHKWMKPFGLREDMYDYYIDFILRWSHAATVWTDNDAYAYVYCNETTIHSYPGLLEVDPARCALHSVQTQTQDCSKYRTAKIFVTFDEHTM
jgi:hypothetical protein